MTGGKTPDGAGFYFPPTILDCSDSPKAASVTEELFAAPARPLKADARRLASAIARG
ncbi:hypothetical protein [Paracoccus mutanolyticus]|uniref:hypothetical protein n=1 Tax=Paracoccus mutanolyticus TaxID=1499308 RepID=UPI001677C7F1|nr:hypothetical protein [Paracoccus mutanolyticus]